MTRAAEPDDLTAILQLGLATPEAPHWTRATYETFLADRAGKYLSIAVLGGEVVGFIAAEMAVGICQLESIAVKQGSRKRGIGAALLSALFSWAGARSASCVELEVRKGNATAIGFYTARRFRHDGVRKGYYRDPDEDAVLMSRALSH